MVEFAVWRWTGRRVTFDIRVGDCLEVLRTMPDESVQMCVTSPPYFGLRDYGHAGQLGLEKTPAEYVEKMVTVFREVRRVLRDDGVLFLNIGDSYAGSGKGQTADGAADPKVRKTQGMKIETQTAASLGLKPKDLIGIPWMLAFALRADGWYLRSDIIWHKPNPMPESVTDRPTKSHEYLFLLTKSATYYYDADAIAEKSVGTEYDRTMRPQNRMNGVPSLVVGRQQEVAGATLGLGSTTRNKRTVWTVTTTPYSGAHFATFPPKLIEPCILAGCPVGRTVLDPFGGAGTTALVADRLGRDAILIELNPEYAEMARRRITDDAPLFAGDAA